MDFSYIAGTGPHPLPTTQCEGTLWVVGRGCGPVPALFHKAV